MIETSINNNDKIFGYHPITPTIKIISAGKIKEPIVKDRFQSDVEDSELDHLGDIPLDSEYKSKRELSSAEGTHSSADLVYYCKFNPYINHNINKSKYYMITTKP